MRLADTSAWSWAFGPRGAHLVRDFRDDLAGSMIAMCDMVRVELLASARNAQDFAIRRERLSLLADCPIGPPQFQRALSVYEQLAGQGGAHQRAVRHPDLLIAAAAESAGVSVLHYDQDFDRIAEITGQPVEWLAPRGSL